MPNDTLSNNGKDLFAGWVGKFDEAMQKLVRADATLANCLSAGGACGLERALLNDARQATDAAWASLVAMRDLQSLDLVGKRLNRERARQRAAQIKAGRRSSGAIGNENSRDRDCMLFRLIGTHRDAALGNFYGDACERGTLFF